MLEPGRSGRPPGALAPPRRAPRAARERRQCPAHQPGWSHPAATAARTPPAATPAPRHMRTSRTVTCACGAWVTHSASPSSLTSRHGAVPVVRALAKCAVAAPRRHRSYSEAACVPCWRAAVCSVLACWRTRMLSLGGHACQRAPRPAGRVATPGTAASNGEAGGARLRRGRMRGALHASVCARCHCRRRPARPLARELPWGQGPAGQRRRHCRCRWPRARADPRRQPHRAAWAPALPAALAARRRQRSRPAWLPGRQEGPSAARTRLASGRCPVLLMCAPAVQSSSWLAARTMGAAWALPQRASKTNMPVPP